MHPSGYDYAQWPRLTYLASVGVHKDVAQLAVLQLKVELHAVGVTDLIGTESNIEAVQGDDCLGFFSLKQSKQHPLI